jgi:RimJ/RimL family protein N-acetyltransferase
MTSEAHLELVPLAGDLGQLAELQSVLESRFDYFERVEGAPPDPTEAQNVYSALPEGFSQDGKHGFGIYRSGVMVGCIDLLVGYPDSCTAMLGLLLVGASASGQGVGSASLRLLDEWIRANALCARVRIGVVRTNEGVLGFWRRMGFIETGELKPYAHGPLKSEIVVLEKPL